MVVTVPSVLVVSLVFFRLTAIGDRALHINMFFNTVMWSLGVILGLALIGGAARAGIFVAETVGMRLGHAAGRNSDAGS